MQDNNTTPPGNPLNLNYPQAYQNIDNIYLPKEVNMVYEEKLQLIDVANLIKTISGSSVRVATKISGTLGYYTGDGSVLSSLGIPLKGLTYGIEEMYACLT